MNKKITKLFLFKIILLVFVVGFGLFSCQRVEAQTYTTSGTGSNNAFPFSSTSSNKVQWVYMASDFAPAITAGNITHVYFKSNSNIATTTFTDLTVKIGYTTQSLMATGNFITPLTTVYSAPSTTFTSLTQGNWFMITLQTPFAYDGFSNFIVEVSQTAYTSGITIIQNSANGLKRLYGGVASATGTAATGLANLGINLAPSVSCTAVTFPTTATAAASPASICVSGNVNLTFTPGSAMPAASGITYQWQSAPTATGPWTNIGPANTTPSYTATVSSPTPTNMFFRCQVFCNSSVALTSSATTAVSISSPGSPTSTTPGSRCGPGVVALGATPPAGATINWYANATGGAPLATATNTYTTPYLPSTTTFYAAAASGSAPANGWVGTGTTTSSNPSPYYTLYYAQKSQFLITAAEMIAAGFGAGTINSIGFDVIGNTGTPLTGFYIKVAPTTLTALTGITDLTALAANYTFPGPGAFTPTANAVNSHVFTTPFVWDGTSNILIETCFNNTSWTTGHTVRTSTTSYTSSFVTYNDVAGFCNNWAGGFTGSYASRPNMLFDMTLGCTGPRVPVVANVNSSTPVPRTSPSVVCNNAVAPIILTPPVAPNNYPSYNWSPVTPELFTNAAATTPYTGGSATSVYMKSPTVGVHTYYMMAGNPMVTTGCTYADTVKIHVQPGNVVIKGQPDTLCAPGGSTTLKLDTIAGYYAGTIQWQTSTNGTTYTNISGATTSTYITPTLSFGNNTYYKAVISSVNSVCETPVKYVVIANPILTSTADSFNCGPGTVTLKATTGGNGAAVWYDVPTLGLALGSGSEFVTPYLTQTDTFYVESAAGGSSLPPTWIGTSTVTTTGFPNPFYTTYEGNRHQLMIRASELAAAGFTAGNITHLAFDILGVTTTLSLTNFTIKLANTTQTDMASWVTSGIQQVYTNPAYVIQPNSVNEFMLSSPFPWDGSSNLVIETCFNNTAWNGSQTIKYTANVGYTASRWYRADAVPTLCSTTTQTGTGTGRPNIRLTMSGGCKSNREPVIAYIHPFPTVDLGGNINQCVDSGTAIVLDAGLQQYTPTFVWDNGPGMQVRAVNATGIYYVTATNMYGCASSDTVNVTLRKNPKVELGNDTSVCNGINLMLNAGTDGIDYFWNTGQTTSTITVNSPGTYNVFVTNVDGCVKTDTITVNMQGQLPSLDGIQITNNGVNTFHFSALNVQNEIGYEWDFGDPFDTIPSYSPNPSHQYTNPGTYIVTLKISSTCGEIIDTTTVHILGLGIDDMDAKVQLALYPNPTTDKLTIEAKNNVRIEQVQVFNLLGQLLKTENVGQIKKHELSLSGLANGMYSIKIQTDKGTVTRKVDLVR